MSPAKKTKKRAPATPPTDEKLLSAARKSCARGLKALDTCIETLSTTLESPGEYDKDLASHLAWLTKHVAQVMGELRKLEDHERKALTQLTPAQVLAWLRTISADERRHIVREAQNLDARGSGLA